MKAIDRAMALRGQIGNREQPNINTAPEKTLGGAGMAALGGAGAGAAAATALGASGPVGWGVIGGGALLSTLGYFDS